MVMKIKAINCPQCGANLKRKNISGNNAYCEYCGNNFFVDGTGSRKDYEESYQTYNDSFSDRAYNDGFSDNSFYREEPKNGSYSRPRKNTLAKVIIIIILIVSLLLTFTAAYVFFGNFRRGLEMESPDNYKNILSPAEGNGAPLYFGNYLQFSACRNIHV